MSPDYPRPHIVIDPAKCWGRPHIKGISTDAIAGMVRAGESIAVVAHEYDLTPHEVVLACWWEGRRGQQYYGVWRWWADDVGQALASARPLDLASIEDPPSRDTQRDGARVTGE